MVITDLSSYDDNGAVILAQSDGKILIGANSLSVIRLLRYNSDGSVDPGFGNVGVGAINLPTQSGCNSLAFQSDGKIMVGGGTSHTPNYYFLLARFDSSGVLSSINEMPNKPVHTNQLSPNPSNGDFNFLNAANATIDIEIYSSDGKLVFKKLHHPSAQILTTNLPSGMYHVKVVDGMHQGVHKVVVVRE
ncbi:MAG: T9SS type A sorting domain-containing protein [Bacteroidetes bacterium]|nr:T9SS type A sorting domain-containing protein [Bacteroidota bacterium]